MAEMTTVNAMVTAKVESSKIDGRRWADGPFPLIKTPEARDLEVIFIFYNFVLS
jgi:hypothetical protein